MSGKLDRLHFTTDVELFHSFAEVSYRGMGNVIRTEDFDGFFDLIKGVNILDSENGQCLIVAWVKQSKAVTGLQFQGIDLFLGDIKGDGDGKQCTICQSQVINHAVEKFNARLNQSGTKGNTNLS